MNAHKPRLALIAVLAVAVSSALAAPPTASFLTPNQYGPQVGQTLNVHYEAGAAKDARPVPWPTNEVDWFFVRAGGEQENSPEARPDRATDNFISISLRHPNVTVIGIDRHTTLTDVTGAELRSFCEQSVGNTPDAIKGLRPESKLHVRQISSAKLLIRAYSIAGAPEPSASANRRTGQKVEIRPIFEPTAVRVGGDLPFCVYVDGVKQPGAKVQATSLATGQTQSFVADGEGSGHFHIDSPGVWRVEFHQVAPPTGDGTEWTVYTGTLSFEVKGGGQ